MKPSLVGITAWGHQRLEQVTTMVMAMPKYPLQLLYPRNLVYHAAQEKFY